MNRYFTFFLAALLAVSSLAFARQRIEKAADMPRFTYQVDGKLEDLVRDADAFSRFAARVHRDIQAVLDEHEIADKSAQRNLLEVQAQIDFLEGRYAAAARRADEIRALEEKPADKLVSGMAIRAMVAAQGKVGDTMSEAYREEVGRLMAAELAGYPFAVIENDIKSAKSWVEVFSEGMILGGLRDQLQPMVDKADGAISSDFAPAIVRSRFALLASLPLKPVLIDTYAQYLAANQVEKADIWVARDVILPEGAGHAPVRIAIWDTGVDTPLFGDRVVHDAIGKPLFIAFDVHANASSDPLMPIPAELRGRLPSMKARLKGFSDLQSNVDSPEASEVKAAFSQLEPEQFKPVIEELMLANYYSHGTHVAGIAMAGNPYAQLVNARMGFSYKLLPDPCPTRELAEKNARNMGAYVDFFRANGVRVVNMSWGGGAKDFESELELCGIGKTPGERQAIARDYFDLWKNALDASIHGAPDILFVAAAGNSNADAAFEEMIPADLSAPNLLTVGAVDKAGDEAPFTSYGPTVKAHANGYQVDSYLPGGERVAFSGTSMASPQVAGLAAKMLAVNPQLQPAEVIAIILATADTTADGRRFLVHQGRAVAAARAKKG